jgi:hypothetical protein
MPIDLEVCSKYVNMHVMICSSNSWQMRSNAHGTPIQIGLVCIKVDMGQLTVDSEVYSVAERITYAPLASERPVIHSMCVELERNRGK